MDIRALAYMRLAKEAPAYWNVGGLFMVLAEAKDTGGAYSIMEQLTPKGPQAVDGVVASSGTAPTQVSEDRSVCPSAP